jgi:hypothetical protein
MDEEHVPTVEETLTSLEQHKNLERPQLTYGAIDISWNFSGHGRSLPCRKSYPSSTCATIRSACFCFEASGGVTLVPALTLSQVLLGKTWICW